ncbi:MAG: heme ABC transporter ATP-binding protein [Candidatus Tectimicrobiota bacterium]
MKPILEVNDLHFAYQQRPVLQQVSFALQPGEFVALVGPNGSGKSTLLRLLLGLVPARPGSILLHGQSLHTLSRKELARRMAFVPQDTAIDFAFTVRDIVAMGRLPHLGRFQPIRRTDEAAIETALTATTTTPLAARVVTHLSGGERQRVVIARAVAQQPQLILLDEPTASLDLVHQLEMLACVRSLVEAGCTALAALHDLTLAARFCDRLLLLHAGQLVAQGAPEQVVTEEHLYRYFGIQARVRWEPEIGSLVVLPLTPAHPHTRGEAHVPTDASAPRA